MKEDFFYHSDTGRCIHGCCWMPRTPVQAVVQIVHGIAEEISRYDHFAEFLNEKGYAVVAEDHMGHGKTAANQQDLGVWKGDWFSAVADTFSLARKVQEKMPHKPYFLLGHSMGSFLARSILWSYPDLTLSGCLLSGTAWITDPILRTGLSISQMVCRVNGEEKSSNLLNRMVFGGYFRRIEHRRTDFDWLSRDQRIVDAYISNPNCGFDASAGLIREMLTGALKNQSMRNLEKMNHQIPIFLLAGSDDPVGDYGKGVKHTADQFRAAGMKEVDMKLYPLDRHEILNELNRDEVYADMAGWIGKHM